MKVVILAAGRGSHLSPFTETRPTGMIHLAGKPILHRLFTMLHSCGFSEIILVHGKNGSSIKDHFGTGKDLGISITYIEQAKPSGIGNALKIAESQIQKGENFLLVYSDIATDENIFSSVIQSFAVSGLPTAGIVLPEKSSEYGNVYLDGAMNITKIVEKPGGKGKGNYVLAGVYVLPSSFYDHLRKTKWNMARAMASIINGGQGLKASIWEKGWIDIRNPWDILTANKMVMDTWKTSQVHQNITVKDAKIKGPVHIEDGVEIRSGVVIHGPAYIGKGCYIGNNVLIRKYSSLGANSSVGFGVELKNCVIFGNTSIGRLSYIGDSVMGQAVTVGSGTMTINGNLDMSEIKINRAGKTISTGSSKLGSFVGDDCQIGTGHNIAPGAVIQNGGSIPHNITYPKGKK